MQKKTADMGGWNVAYTDQGEGLPVVLLHGFCGSGAYWDEIVPLLESSCRVIVPDLRGHGASGSPNESYSIEAMAGDVAKLIEGLGLGENKPVVLGHSLGGYVALALAEKQADKLRAFGLVHSTAYPDDERGRAGREKSIQTIREQGLPAFLDGLIPRLFAPAHLESMPAAVSKAKEIGLGTSPEGAVRTLEAMRDRPDRNAVLWQTKLPVLLVAGVADQVISEERTFSVGGENISQQRIEAAGHISMMEAPGQLAQIIKSFISGL